MNRPSTRPLAALTAALIAAAAAAPAQAGDRAIHRAVMLGINAIPTQTATQRFAVVDTTQVFAQSRAGKAAFAEVQRVQEQKQAELETQAKALEALRQRILAGADSLPADQLDPLKLQFQEGAGKLQRAQDDARREIDKLRNEKMSVLNEQVMPIIQQIAEDQGYSFILKKFESGLVYADDSADISGEVIRRLDAGNP